MRHLLEELQPSLPPPPAQEETQRRKGRQYTSVVDPDRVGCIISSDPDRDQNPGHDDPDQCAVQNTEQHTVTPLSLMLSERKKL